jgi:DNA-binding MarR family transcriptional regulator
MVQMNAPKTEELSQAAIDRFWEVIPPLWNLVRENVRSIASEQFDISVEQFHILRHIRRGVTSVSDLAEAKGISRPAISQAVDLLVEKGLISRQQEKGDRRFVKLALTPAGDDLMAQIFKENRAWMASRLESLSPGDLECLVQGLQTLKIMLRDEIG